MKTTQLNLPIELEDLKTHYLSPTFDSAQIINEIIKLQKLDIPNYEKFLHALHYQKYGVENSIVNDNILSLKGSLNTLIYDKNILGNFLDNIKLIDNDTKKEFILAYSNLWERIESIIHIISTSLILEPETINVYKHIFDRSDRFNLLNNRFSRKNKDFFFFYCNELMKIDPSTQIGLKTINSIIAEIESLNDIDTTNPIFQIKIPNTQFQPHVLLSIRKNIIKFTTLKDLKSLKPWQLSETEFCFQLLPIYMVLNDQQHLPKSRKSFAEVCDYLINNKGNRKDEDFVREDIKNILDKSNKFLKRHEMDFIGSNYKEHKS